MSVIANVINGKIGVSNYALFSTILLLLLRTVTACCPYRKTIDTNTNKLYINPN